MSHLMLLFVLICLVWVFFAFDEQVFANEIEPFTLKSPAFNNGSIIPKKYTCDGENISPELTWENSPLGTVSYVLLCEDPDAPVGIWVHWIIYNIPETTKTLPENLKTNKELITQQMIFMGINDFKKLEYGGPCPPPGKPHRYFFRLLALDIKLPEKPGLNRNQILNAVKGHILEEAQLIGLYSR